MIKEKEIWKEIINTNGYYFISNYGNVKLKTKLTAGCYNENNYLIVTIQHTSEQRTYKVHRFGYRWKFWNKNETN